MTQPEAPIDDVISIDYCKKMTGFTKLFSSLVYSTVWREEMHVKVVWITMLAIADRNGFVAASVPGLADASRVTIPQCRDAIDHLKAPDPDSRTKLHEGRRIEDGDGGWRILNYLKYRELASRDERRIAVRQAVIKHRKSKQLKSDVIDGNQSNHKQKQKQRTEADQDNNLPPDGGAWLKPYLDTYSAMVGKAKPGLIAHAVSEPHRELGTEKAQALWLRWCQSTKSDFGPAWFAQHWRKATDTKGATRGETQQDRNFKAIEEGLRDGE